MDAATFARFFDHTILKPEATEAKVLEVCREALKDQFCAVCVNPANLPLVAKTLQGSAVMPISVVGFPLGAVPTHLKVAEAQWVIGEGAREIDMVVHAGAYLSGETSKETARRDIARVIEAAGAVPVKVILETSLLNRAQIVELTGWCAEAGAAFVKTSTGFGARGASADDVRAMHETLSLNPAWSKTKIKASGGIKTLEFALELIALGASRIGSSVSTALVDEFKGRG